MPEARDGLLAAKDETMSTCILALRKSKAYNTPLGIVRQYTFWQMYETHFDRAEKQQDAIDRFAARFGHQEDCLVTMGGDSRYRPLVYRQAVALPLVYDSHSFSSHTYVGVLEKVSGRWVINTEVGETEDFDNARESDKLAAKDETMDITLTPAQASLLKSALVDRHSKLGSVAGFRGAPESNETAHQEMEDLRALYEVLDASDAS